MGARRTDDFMSLWYSFPTPEQLNDSQRKTLSPHLGIEFTEVGEDFLAARMPVDERTIQPFGLLHGGASVALAETLGSVAASLTIDLSQKMPVGMEINANHIRPVTSGWVVGIVKPIHIGGSTQVWEIRITTEAGKLVCISRITLAVISRNRE
jgi:1,4-dihydroxy-2-naphthoyl-CoA hydrolase